MNKILIILKKAFFNIIKKVLVIINFYFINLILIITNNISSLKIFENSYFSMFLPTIKFCNYSNFIIFKNINFLLFCLLLNFIIIIVLALNYLKIFIFPLFYLLSSLLIGIISILKYWEIFAFLIF